MRPAIMNIVTGLHICLSVIIGVSAFTIVGCLQDSGRTTAGNRIKEITYRFRDASVPPAYHRSYTLTVTRNTFSVIVDSYGDVLAQKQFQVSERQFLEIVDSLKRNRIRNCSLGEPNGCTGGTGEKISFSDDRAEIFSGSIYHCGKRDSGNLCGDVTRFAKDIKDLVPNLTTIVK